MKTIIIVAMTPDRLIGKDGGLPWHEPADLKHFKRTTTGHAIIMGRKTFDGIGKPLPKRRNIVITRNKDCPSDSAQTEPSTSATSLDFVHSLEEAFALCRRRCEEKAFVIGGAQVYALALPVVDEMIVSYMDKIDVSGDTFFPVWDPDAWVALPTSDDQKDSPLRITRYARTLQ